VISFILPTTKLELVLAALVHDVPHDAQRNRDEAWSQWLNTERLTSNDTQSDREDSERRKYKLQFRRRKDEEQANFASRGAFMGYT
jgi:hypothetical protein